MRAFTRLQAVALPMFTPNVDTDAIIPSRCIKSTSKEGLGPGLFANQRYLPGDLEPNPDFVLNRPEYSGAAILIGGANFGCGSSREQAVWALAEHGFRALIAPSYGGIFARNCLHNGLLPVVLPQERVAELAAWVAQDPQRHQLDVDLQALQVRRCKAGQEGEALAFALDEDARQMLLQGLDAVGLTLQGVGSDIEAFERRDRQLRPWLHSGAKGAETEVRP